MIYVYPADCTDFSTNGKGTLSPLSAEVTETLNGEYELTLVHPIDEAGKWQRLVEGCILRAPVPAAMTPRVSFTAPGDDTQMLGRYEGEQKQLREKCEKLQQSLISTKEKTENSDRFIRLVKSITQPETLTPELVGNLIERVEVGDVYIVDGEKKQDVRILFNFVGEIGC